MGNKFFTSDTHYGQESMLTYKRSDGSPLRDFSSVEEMDEFMVDAWNRRVGSKDTVYHLGDVVTKKKHLSILNRLNGTKILIPGNHDIFPAKDYLQYFEDIKGYVVLSNRNILFTHIPISLENRGKYGLCVHGHTHSTSIADPFYYNVSVEQFDYEPVVYDDIIKYMERYID